MGKAIPELAVPSIPEDYDLDEEELSDSDAVEMSA